MDWKDILTHFAASIGIGFIGLILFGHISAEFVVPVIGAWVWREIEQDINKGHTGNPWPFRRSTQKDAEALAAVVPIFVMVVML